MTAPFLKGKRIALVPLDRSHLDGPYVDWLNDAEVCRHNSHGVMPYNRVAAERYLQTVADRGDVVLAIIVSADGRHIGNISLQDISWFHRTADLAFLLGDRACWGQGYGTEAGRLLLAHGFGPMGLHRVTAGTLCGNTAMRALAARLGMREEGVRRKALFKDGDHHDLVVFGLLASEFEGGAADG